MSGIWFAVLGGGAILAAIVIYMVRLGRQVRPPKPPRPKINVGPYRIETSATPGITVFPLKEKQDP